MRRRLEFKHGYLHHYHSTSIRTANSTAARSEQAAPTSRERIPGPIVKMELRI